RGSSQAGGPPGSLCRFNGCLLWAVMSGGSGSRTGVQFGLQLCDLYSGVYGAHPSGLAAARTALSALLGGLAATQLGVMVRAICIASTAYTAGTITIYGAFKV